jgi:hypothetical protein
MRRGWDWSKRGLVALTAFASVTLGLLIPSSPAQALWADCPDGYFCQWNDAYAAGPRWQWTAAQIHELGSDGIRGIGMHSGNNNNASSWRNRTSFRINTYDGINCTYAKGFLNPGDYYSAVGDRSHYNDVVSSIVVQGDPTPCV